MFAYTWNLFISNNSIGIAGRYNLFVWALYGFVLFFFIRTYNAYLIEYTRIKHIVFELCLSTVISTLGVYFLILIAWNKHLSPIYFLILTIAQIGFNVLWAWSAALFYRKSRKTQKAAVVYRNQNDLNRIKDMDELFKKYLTAKKIENPQTIDDIIPHLDRMDAVFILGINATLRNGIVKYCAEKNIECFFMPHVGDVIMMSGEHIQAFSVPIMNISGSNIRLEDAIVKRLFDLILSVVAAIILSPFMIAVAIAIKADDGGSILYKQERLTINGKKFNIFKFRSMVENAESDGVAVLSTGENDDRITKVGKFIRKTRLDELPQLFNIIKGDMSIVGPRPERPEIAAEYEEKLPSFKLRLQVKAGLTGYAQVYGKYNTDPYDKLEMDLIYISRMSVLLDFQIMLATIPILFRKESTEGFNKNE